MTTATAAPPKPHVFYASPRAKEMTFRGHEIEYRQDGTALIKGVRVFRVGTFRDSWGEQHTWTPEHMQLFAANFKLLSESGIFPDPPARRDHSFTVDKVMGYIENLYVDGEFLVADHSVTDPVEVENLKTGKYRNVSLEVGMYVTNDETAYWPVVFGVAYVDIPAVEGLHTKGTQSVLLFSRMNDQEESTVTTENSNPQTPPDAGASRPQAFTFRIGGNDTTDFARVQAYIADIEGENAALKTQNEGLVQFQRDQVKVGRQNFVSSLAKDGKVLADQVSDLNEMVEDMNDAQFEKFKAMYEKAPKLTVLEQHGSTGGHTTDPAAGVSAKEQEIADLREMVQMHSRSGMTEEQVQSTRAAKRLAELTKN